MRGEFGTQTPGLIRDHNWTHPNIELRMVFMNYYLNPDKQKREQKDNYLYNRELQHLTGSLEIQEFTREMERYCRINEGYLEVQRVLDVAGL